MAVTIQHIEPGSPAEAAGLRPGMALCTIDGHDIRDGLDYEFYSAAENPVLLLRLNNNTEIQLRVSKGEYEPLGCGFGSYLIDGQHRCRNNCVFCFIDQMPPGMRESLYFKDDDERLSFLFGNYVTLTNLSDKEIDRIIEMRIAPINISVHTVDPALRVQMMGNRFAGEALDAIPRLAAAGIPMNFQLVLCPGVNDGPQLRRSLAELAGYGEVVQSIAAVPVGLTRHRDGLPSLAPYTKESAAAQLDIMLEVGDGLLAQAGRRVIFPADEWFLLAGRAIPKDDFYEDYPQLENGVGMWRLFATEFRAALAAWPQKDAAGAADIAVGTLAAPLLRQLAEELQEAIPGARLHVHAVENDFFGHGVTVTGLLTGGDIIRQLGGKLHTDTLLLPPQTLRAEGDLLLDDVSPADISAALGAQVRTPESSGAALLEAILGV